jgi:hypothetical protein
MRVSVPAAAHVLGADESFVPTAVLPSALRNTTCLHSGRSCQPLQLIATNYQQIFVT